MSGPDTELKRAREEEENDETEIWLTTYTYLTK